MNLGMKLVICYFFGASMVMFYLAFAIDITILPYPIGFMVCIPLLWYWGKLIDERKKLFRGDVMSRALFDVIRFIGVMVYIVFEKIKKSFKDR